MHCITAPEVETTKNSDAFSLFLAGGISGCPDWQNEMIQLLSDLPITLFNPRRNAFPLEPIAIHEQIEWEYTHLRKASAILFWFPQETLCPITLYELGAHAMRDVPLFVGTHLNYARRQDVEIQLGLVRPEVKVMSSLHNLSEAIQTWVMTLDKSEKM